jgi:HAD superfamily hydrolase (TIGR01490 family)
VFNIHLGTESVTSEKKGGDLRAAFFDVDGTLTKERVWLGLMRYFRECDPRPGIHMIFLGYHYPLYLLKRVNLVSEASFRGQWAAHLGWYFRNYEIDEVEKIWKWILNEFVEKIWRSDIRELVDNHRKSGDLVVLVSGGPEQLLLHIAGELGVEHVVGTPFETRNGIYTGRPADPVCVGKQKPRSVQNYLKRVGVSIDMRESFAYADSASDIHLLNMVGNPVAVYPFNDLRMQAEKRGWKIYPEN